MAQLALTIFVFGTVLLPLGHHVQHALEAWPQWHLALELIRGDAPAAQPASGRDATQPTAHERLHALGIAHEPGPPGATPAPSHRHPEDRAPDAPHGSSSLAHGQLAVTAALELSFTPAPPQPLAAVAEPPSARPIAPRLTCAVARGPPGTPVRNC